IFLDLTLERRVEYMLHWCDVEKREEGFRRADAVLLGLFEGFNPDEEMKIDFTDQDEYRWRVFCNRNIDRLASDGEYRLGGCIFIPVGLNFGKELLEDFKTSALFQGSDLENCQKGIKMLRDLMMKTAEKMKRRLP
ncbi:hypothetical protein BGZ47_004517, partial [Haplosporangium gracile]